MESFEHNLWERICFNLPSLWAMIRQWFVRKQPLHIMSSEETLTYIAQHQCSLARYGDGEWRIQRGGGEGYQSPSASLRRRLDQLIAAPHPDCLISLPNVFQSLEGFIPTAEALWRRILRLQRAWVYQCFAGGYYYGDALVSRFYIDTLDVVRAQHIITLWKRLWKGRDLLIVEGEFARMGVNSNLFENVASIQRILCPSSEAWERYDDILATIKQHAQGKLVLLVLGPTATVLAYDLAQIGIQAIDCGHLEVEYQWFLMRATEKVPIPNRWVHEAGGLSEAPEDEALKHLYESQILATIR